MTNQLANTLHHSIRLILMQIEGAITAKSLEKDKPLITADHLTKTLDPLGGFALPPIRVLT